MKKVCVVTSSRAEYGLLKPLLQEIDSDAKLNLQLIVTGTHLSEEFGNRYNEIETDFDITRKVEMDLSNDTPLQISLSQANLQISMSKVLSELNPDIVVILGDRFEILAVVTSAMMLNIPIAHIHGGETTEGAIDEAIRHSITKMSHIHLCATKKYRDRVIQLGEQPDCVYNVGALGVENIQKLQLLNKDEFEKSIKFKLNKKNILITFHPTTLENRSSKEQFQELLNALDELQDTNIIFTKANADADGKIINEMIDDYVKHNIDKSVCYISLGQLRYLSALQFVDAVVGNSSSGIIEAPSFNIATINIGDRQKGREQAKSIINTEVSKQDIKNAIEEVYTDKFRTLLKESKNPYQSDDTAKKIKDIIKKTSLTNILKKKFFDL